MPLYCRKCGARLFPGSSFCPTCGASQMENDQVLTSPPRQEPAMIGTGRQPEGAMLRQRYRLLHTVGRGGMGAVYVAQDTQLGDRLVAVKEMSMSRLALQELPQAVEQFRREAHLLASLHHPGLPAIHEYFQEQARWYLVMSFIEGQNLQAVLNAAPENRLPVNEVVRIGIELCKVLDYLHNHEPQVIFRDLKPSNIMLTPRGHICLIDFGIARHFKQEQTKDTMYYYSVGYAPPEQYGQAQTSPQSDLYSLGATLHQMLSGHRPADHPFQFSNLHLIDPTLPPPLVQVITHTLEMNEKARPESAAAVKARLEQVLAPVQIEPTKEVVPQEKTPIEPTKEVVPQEKTQLPARAVNSSEPATPTSTRNNLWVQIERFLSKRRWVAWMSFIVVSLTLGALLPWLTWNSDARFDSPFAIGNVGITYNSPPYITIIGAVGAAGVGLIFLLLKRRRPLLEILGGIALSGIAFINFTSVEYFPRTTSGTFCDIPTDCNTFIAHTYDFMPTRPNHYFSFFIFLTLFLLWLLIGTCFFLRSANTPGRLLLGTLLIIGGMFLLWPLGMRVFFLPPFILLPALIWGVCGIIALIIAFRKRNFIGAKVRNRQGTSE